MRPAAAPAQAHGADIYDARGRPLDLLDFSSTVVSLGPPGGWERRAAAALPALTRYPPPRGRGLDAALESRLGAPPGSVLVSAGASEALDWCARLAVGRRVRLLAPCFGEYRPLLERAGARVEEAWGGPGQAMDPRALLRGLGRGDQVWAANPGNPFGRVMGPGALSRLWSLCSAREVVLVLDEALAAQRLDPAADPAALPPGRAMEHCVVVRSLGKGLGLPGLRLGYLVAAPGLASRLRAFQPPWSVQSQSLALGLWVFERERRDAPRRRAALAARARDLAGRLAALGLEPTFGGTTGFFCVPLGGAQADRVAGHLEKLGLRVRSCGSFGAWGRSWLRLNPRAPSENRVLAGALAAALGAA